MTEIFISYKTEERAQARRVAHYLGDLGYEVWWDVDGLLGGDEFADSINAVIAKTKLTLVLWSPAALESPWVMAEALKSFDLDKLMSARIAKCELPVPYNAGQAVDLIEASDGDEKAEEAEFAAKLQRLQAAVEKKIGPPAKPAIPPKEAEAQAMARDEQQRQEAVYWQTIISNAHPSAGEYQLYLDRFGENATWYDLAKVRRDDCFVREAAESKQRKGQSFAARYGVYIGLIGLLIGTVGVVGSILQKPYSQGSSARQVSKLKQQLEEVQQANELLQKKLLAGQKGEASGGKNTQRQEEKLKRANSFWGAIEKSPYPNAKEYQLYLDRFGPNGVWSDLAKVRRDIFLVKEMEEKRQREEGSLFSRYGLTISFLVVLVSIVGLYLDYFRQKPNSSSTEAQSKKPEMVRIPAGSFIMGGENDPGHNSNETPNHRVTFAKPFAMGKYAVTFREWDACVAAGGCRHKPDDEGWGRGGWPVINVSWDDVQEYIAWLNKHTGQNYRLPTEAEWEYAARAGTRTPFYTGETITTEQANFNGKKTSNGSGNGRYLGCTLQVNRFAGNAWGLLNMHGNVREWVEDCWHDNYKDAPSDGAAWLQANGGNSDKRVLRGGSWRCNPEKLRAAAREEFAPENRNRFTGFRLAQDL